MSTIPSPVNTAHIDDAVSTLGKQNWLVNAIAAAIIVAATTLTNKYFVQPSPPDPRDAQIRALQEQLDASKKAKP